MTGEIREVRERWTRRTAIARQPSAESGQIEHAGNERAGARGFAVRIRYFDDHKSISKT